MLAQTFGSDHALTLFFHFKPAEGFRQISALFSRIHRQDQGSDSDLPQVTVNQESLY